MQKMPRHVHAGFRSWRSAKPPPPRVRLRHLYLPLPWQYAVQQNQHPANQDHYENVPVVATLYRHHPDWALVAKTRSGYRLPGLRNYDWRSWQQPSGFLNPGCSLQPLWQWISDDPVQRRQPDLHLGQYQLQSGTAAKLTGKMSERFQRVDHCHYQVSWQTTYVPDGYSPALAP